MSESFSTQPTSAILPSYAYGQYAFDATVQAFFSAQNALSQVYLDWDNNTLLALYTSAGISGVFLDWIGQGIYGIKRPVLTTFSSSRMVGYNAAPYNTLAYDALVYSESGGATIANDDIYKRVMTWNTYKGDGQVFSMFWLKNRINRFLNGIDGTDWPVLNDPPGITVSGTTFAIQAGAGSIYSTLAQCIANDVLALPFQYTFVVVLVLTNNGGVLDVSGMAGWPTSSLGLSDGAIWDNGGVASVVTPTSPSPTAPAVYFGNITAAALLALGGGNLPLTNPGVGSNQLWNNGGVISIA